MSEQDTERPAQSSGAVGQMVPASFLLVTGIAVMVFFGQSGGTVAGTITAVQKTFLYLLVMVPITIGAVVVKERVKRHV